LKGFWGKDNKEHSSTTTPTTTSTIIQEERYAFYIFHNNKGKPCLAELDFLKRISI